MVERATAKSIAALKMLSIGCEYHNIMRATLHAGRLISDCAMSERNSKGRQGHHRWRKMKSTSFVPGGFSIFGHAEWKPSWSVKVEGRHQGHQCCRKMKSTSFVPGGFSVAKHASKVRSWTLGLLDSWTEDVARAGANLKA